MSYLDWNKKAIDTVNTLTTQGIFVELEAIDSSLVDNKDPFDKRFYLTQQDKLNSIYGELRNMYSELLSQLKRYIVVRKLEMRLEFEQSDSISVKGDKITPSREPGSELLEDLAKAEVDQLYQSTILLEGWLDHCDQSIKTCRNHTYIEQSQIGTSAI